jgi:ATP-dependent exoDNAse (exonuclease V) alpha subunit
VLAATAPCGIGIIEGAPGAGKTTTLASIVQLYRDDLGCRVIGTANSWRISANLQELGIESRATAAWIASLKSGHRIFNSSTILICDESGLLSSREMLTISSAVAAAGGKLLLVGSRQQLQPIGAGGGLDLVSRAVAAARVETIVRQTEKWIRDAITDFGKGRAAAALDAFAERGLLIQAQGAKAAITAVVNEAERASSQAPNDSLLILARTNAAVAAISREVRERRKAAGLVTGKEVTFAAATPSGHRSEISVARGDRIRFLVRNDDLGVINGTVANILRVTERRGLSGKRAGLRIEAEIGDRRVAFDPRVLADGQGLPRIGWAYAATIAGCQGLTVDRAVVLVEPTCNRYDIFVASSRARQGMGTTLVVDAKGIDRRLAAEFPIDRQGSGLAFSDEERRAWLAERLSRASPKVSTLDVIESSSREPEKQLAFAKARELELDHGL